MADEELFVEIDPELLAEFVDESVEELDGLESKFLELEKEPGNAETIASIFRPVHTIKGNSAFFGLMKVKKLAHDLESLLTLAKDGKVNLKKDVIDIVLSGVDFLKQMLVRSKNGESEVINDGHYNELIEAIGATKGEGGVDYGKWDELFARVEQLKDKAEESEAGLCDNLQEVVSILESLKPVRPKDKESKGKVSEFKGGKEGEVKVGGEGVGDSGSSVGEVASEKSDEKSSCKVQSKKTIRIAEESIDDFLEFVGELVVVSEMYSFLQKRVSDAGQGVLSDEFKRVNETFNSLSDNLQKSIMHIRKVPVKGLLQRVPRMIRDIANSSGKEIEVVLGGEDIEVDKSILETLDGPLTHMVRNAADHGIESPEDRKASGKDPKGVIKVEFRETADHIYMEISDDGKGLNFDALRDKAVSIGLISADENLKKDKVVDLIFASGVSTAQSVTDVSGRGVGMDVVKKNIDKANGKINIETEAGKGSMFSLKLPKSISTQIIDGFVFKLGPTKYVVNTEKVTEAFHPSGDEVTDVAGRGRCVMNHGRLLPIVPLREIFSQYEDIISGGGFDLEGDEEVQDDRVLMVSMQSGNTEFAVEVDEIVGIQKVVLKKISSRDIKSEIFKGAAIMGDGTVAMVLDVDKVKRT